MLGYDAWRLSSIRFEFTSSTSSYAFSFSSPSSKLLDGASRLIFSKVKGWTKLSRWAWSMRRPWGCGWYRGSPTKGNPWWDKWTRI